MRVWRIQYALPHGHKCYLHVLSLRTELLYLTLQTQTTLVIRIRVSFHCCATAFNDGEPVVSSCSGWQDYKEHQQPQRSVLTHHGASMPRSILLLACTSMVLRPCRQQEHWDYTALYTHTQIASLKPHFKRRSVTHRYQVGSLFPCPHTCSFKSKFSFAIPISFVVAYF